MIDAYCHLDLTHNSAVQDIELQILHAGVSRVFLIETWNRQNRSILDNLLSIGDTERFPIALCYRASQQLESLKLLKHVGISGIRMLTADICGDSGFAHELARSGKMLVAHSEAGIRKLTDNIRRFSDDHPLVPIYVPHLGWPIIQGKIDMDWPMSIKNLASLPTVTIGISAIAHFSQQPFPHADVYNLALELLSCFPPERVVIGTDYPLCAKDRYKDYIDLAREWITSVYSRWISPPTFLSRRGVFTN